MLEAGSLADKNRKWLTFSPSQAGLNQADESVTGVGPKKGLQEGSGHWGCIWADKSGLEPPR
jgi:hypothetical protein